MEINSASPGACSIGQNAQSTKRKFFQWAVKWFYANMSEDYQEKPDAPLLACLLQSIGFQLRKFEKIDETRNSDEENFKNESVRVTIECGTSNMRACLEMDDVKCRCPNSEDAKDASFWSVSGTAPASTVETGQKVEESGSNLLPPMSKDMKKLLNEVIYRLLGMIGDKSIDHNRNDKSRSNLNLSRVSSTKDIIEKVSNEEKSPGVFHETHKKDSMNIFRSYTQPEIAVSGTNSALRRYNWTARSLVKESISGIPGLISKPWNQTIDIECASIESDQPRPSPPKISSSPVFFNQLCSSLGQISLQSEEETGNLAEYVMRAHRSIEKALEIILGKKSPLSRNSSTSEQGTFLKPPQGGLNLTGSAARKKSTSNCSLRASPTNATNSRPGSSCSTSSQVLSKSVTSRQSLTLPNKSPMTRRSVGSELSSTPLSSVYSTKRNVQSSNIGVSKIPGHRKSFGAYTGQSLKLAVPKSRNSASETKKKSISPTFIAPEDRVIVTAKRRVSPDPKIHNTSGIQKPGISLNQGNTSAIAVPTLKVAPVKTFPTTKESSTRKSLPNTKFGFCNKKP